MKIIAIRWFLFLFTAMIIVGTIGTNIAPTEETKERIILKSELEELKFLFGEMEVKIVKIKNKTVSIYNPPSETQEIMLILKEYHPYVEKFTIILNEDIKKMDKETSAIIPEKNYINIKITKSTAIKINEFLDNVIKQLKKNFPEL